jgi:hypothetical protein
LKKIILISILSLFIFDNNYAQTKYSNLIEWDATNKIKWDDFQSKIDSSSHFKAECTTLFECFFYLKNDSVFCRIKTFFNPEKSWKKTIDLNNFYDLNHEQRHFDITEIYARKIRQIIINNKLNEESIQKIYRENAKACNDFQTMYDRETNHSINITKQKFWDKKIDTLLLSLEDYKEQDIFIYNPSCKLCWK